METIEIKKSILEKYKNVAISPKDRFKFPTGKEGLSLLAYDDKWISTLPSEKAQFFCGIGNPVDIKKIPAQATVLDFGCGGGLDMSYMVYKTPEISKVIGVDISSDMLSRANELNPDFETRKIDNEHLPFRDHTFDVITANGSINLVLNKQMLFDEFYRILKPNGRLQFADMTLKSSVDPKTISADSWSE